MADIPGNLHIRGIGYGMNVRISVASKTAAGRLRDGLLQSPLSFKAVKVSSKLIRSSLIIFLFALKAGSQTAIDARGFYDLACQLCESYAADIQMYALYGSDLDTTGKSQNWGCRLLSFQKDQVYWCTYTSDSVSLDTITGILIAPFVVEDDWINSDKALLIAEQNGGMAFRNNIINYRITADLSRRPSPPFYTYWHIKYADLDSASTAFEIRINAVTEAIITGIETNRNASIVRKFTLFGNYPNPFNNSTVFQFKLETRGLVRLNIYDMLGKKIEAVLNETLSPGRYKIKWKAGNYPSGIYFYSLSVDEEIGTGKLVLTK